MTEEFKEKPIVPLLYAIKLTGNTSQVKVSSFHFWCQDWDIEKLISNVKSNKAFSVFFIWIHNVRKLTATIATPRIIFSFIWRLFGESAMT